LPKEKIIGLIDEAMELGIRMTVRRSLNSIGMSYFSILA
jgi:hypothetical protein